MAGQRRGEGRGARGKREEGAGDKKGARGEGERGEMAGWRWWG